MKLGENIIAGSGLPPFFTVSNESRLDLASPKPRRGAAVRTAVRSLSGFQKEALVASSENERVWRLVSDEGAYLNGHDAAPCPLAFLTCGMVAGYLDAIHSLADREGVTLRQLRLRQDNYYTMSGSMLKRTMTGGAEPVELVVEIDADLSVPDLDRLVGSAIKLAPVQGLLAKAKNSRFNLICNGETLPTAKVDSLETEPVPVPDFAKIIPITPLDELVEPIGPTPDKEVALGTSAGGSSLADQQNRRLNVGAIAERSEDGITRIQQLLYSPHGTSFRFLSSEDGRAPDSNTLLSAGIAFCFMTQFGRFVSMTRLDLPSYEIVQDTHFAMGRIDEDIDGDADPVETHVFLETSEPEQTAQEMLDIAEQTCFLHALCRSQLETRIRIEKVE